MIIEMMQVQKWKGVRNKLQLKVCQVAHASLVHLDKY